MQEQESQLVIRSKNGDRKAYEQLYRANVGKIYALCLRLCGQREMAEDMTQESFIRAWQKLDSFRGDSAFSSWLFRLSSNVVVGELRKQAKWQIEEYCEQSHQQSPAPDTLNSAASDIEKALIGLSDQARVVLIMYEYLGYKHVEISEITGMAVGTSKTHLHRARTTLRNRAA